MSVGPGGPKDGSEAPGGAASGSANATDGAAGPGGATQTHATARLQAGSRGLSEETAFDVLFETLDLGTVGGTVNHPGETIRPPALALSASESMARLEDLTGGTRLVTGEVLGEGGMGVVRRAQQASLRRDVAVKTLRADRSDTRSAAKLLQEAYVAGQLEHPNVVPVYDLGAGDDGLPFLVMRRIEGTPWAELLRDAAKVRERFGDAADPLEVHLRILVQVCGAVAFAHERGVVHRDLKPSNVMIGAMREVYLLDWGLAARVAPDPDGRLPWVGEDNAIAGTPAYMAPEQVDRRRAATTTRSDVYLLGAILYEIVVGRPPHEASSPAAALFKAATVDPEIPAEIPEELAGLLRAALRRDPEARLPSADALRVGLEGFLRHRGALALLTEADAQRETLEALIEGGRPEEDDGGHARAVRDAFAGARFGYEAALRIWPESTAARGGVAAARAAMVRHALDAGEAKEAAGWLAEIADPDPELAFEVASAMEAVASRERLYARLAREGDRAAGQWQRTAILGLVGATWISSPGLAPAWGWYSGEDPGQLADLVWSVVFFGVASGIYAISPWVLPGTALNRGMVRTLVLLPLVQVVIVGGAVIQGIPADESRVLLIGYWTAAMAYAGLLLEPYFMPAAASYAVGYLVASARPEWSIPVMFITNAVFLANVGLTQWLKIRGREKGRVTLG